MKSGMISGALVLASFRGYFRVRGTLLGPLVFLTIMFLVEGSFWSAMGRDGLGGYTRETLLFYMAAALVISQITACTGEPDSLSAKIECGRLDGFLLRPGGFLGGMAAVQIGTALARTATLFPVLVAAMLAFLDRLDVVALASLVPLLAIGAVLNFLINSTISNLTFVLRDSYAFVVFKETLFWVLSGALIPLDFFPERLRAALEWFPPAYVVYFPTRVALGAASLAEVMPRALVLLVVAGALFVCTWRLGVRRYQAFGG